MKIRTLNELQDKLDHEFSWRLKEISNLKREALRPAGLSGNTVIRAGLALIYAHWEGFVKNSSHLYIDYVDTQKLKYDQLTANFVAIGAKRFVTSITESRSSILNNQIAEFFCTQMGERAKLSFNSAIRTESNLSSKVFENIAHAIGIDHSNYEAKSNFIDKSLLSRRNEIAHGSYLEVDDKGFVDLADEVIGLLRSIKTDIENAAILKSYLR